MTNGRFLLANDDISILQYCVISDYNLQLRHIMPFPETRYYQTVELPWFSITTENAFRQNFSLTTSQSASEWLRILPSYWYRHDNACLSKSLKYKLYYTFEQRKCISIAWNQAKPWTCSRLLKIAMTVFKLPCLQFWSDGGYNMWLSTVQVMPKLHNSVCLTGSYPSIVTSSNYTCMTLLHYSILTTDNYMSGHTQT